MDLQQERLFDGMARNGKDAGHFAVAVLRPRQLKHDSSRPAWSKREGALAGSPGLH